MSTRGPLRASEVAYLHGLIGHWKFSEGSGANAADSTALVNTATLTGGTSWTSDCAGNNALLTNGAGSVRNERNLFTALRRYGGLLDAGAVHQLFRAVLWEMAAIGRFGRPPTVVSHSILASPFAGSEQFTTQGPVCTSGQWYHITAVFNDIDNTYKVYVDGQLRTSGTSPVDLLPQPAAILSFGTRTGAAEYWSGALRDVRITIAGWSPRRLPNYVGWSATGSWTKPAAQSASDSSGAGNMGTVNGTAAWNAGRANNSLRLDGNTSLTVPSLLGNPKNVTISAWAKLLTPDSWGREVISLGDSFALRPDDSGQAKAIFYNRATWIIVPYTQTYAGAGWHHFAAVFNDDQDYCKLYIDGIERASVTTSASIAYTLNPNLRSESTETTALCTTLQGGSIMCGFTIVLSVLGMSRSFSARDLPEYESLNG